MQQDGADSSSFPVQTQPFGKAAVSPPIESESVMSVRPPSVPALRLAAQQAVPLPAESAASAQSQDSGASHANHTGGPALSSQPAPPGAVMGDGAVHQSRTPAAMAGPAQPFPPSTVTSGGAENQAVAPSVSGQNSPIRGGNTCLGLSQSSAWGGPPVSVHPSSLPSPVGNGTSSAGAIPALQGDPASKDTATQGAPDLAAQGQLMPGVVRSAQLSEEVGGTPGPSAEYALQQSPPLGGLSFGSTPAVQTIKGMCSRGTPMPAQLSPATPSSMPGVLLGGLQQHDSSVVGTAGSPAMVGSLGLGSTPAAYTIRALENVGQAPKAGERESAPVQGKLWQVASVHAPVCAAIPTLIRHKQP